MVFFFATKDTNYVIYMGKDKFENEDLIKYGWPEDVWFHVSDLSSAHVYLRLPSGVTIDSIPTDILNECCQLVKANSIEGSKKAKVKVSYTMWSNLHKRASMDTGQIGFHEEKAIKYVDNVEKDNVIVNKITKTKTEITAEQFKEAREKRDKDEKARLAKERQKRELDAKKQKLEREKEKQERSYDTVFTSTKTKKLTNTDIKMTDKEYEESFF